MQRALAIAGMVVAGLIALLFGFDLLAGILEWDVLFGGRSMLMDVGSIICALVLAYMSWTTFREAA
jgi:hypothetical protein